MKIEFNSLISLTLAFTFIGVMRGIPTNINIVPYPQSIELTNLKLRIETNLRLNLLGPCKSERVLHSSTHFMELLQRFTGIFIQQPPIKNLNEFPNSNFNVQCQNSGKLSLEDDESYSLLITSESIHIQAATDIGAMHALRTLLQMISADSEGYYFYTANIKDFPRFKWRGLMIDVVRHWMKEEVLLRNIEAMAFIKLNVLHLHLSDDQGFRVECKKFPLLHLNGSDGNYYTHSQLKKIIKFASNRGIRVIPEFDVPGHSTSWMVGYPELGSMPGPFEIIRRWTGKNVMNPTLNITYEIVEGLYEEMSQIFPCQEFHIGGDEVSPKQWKHSTQIQNFMKEHSIKNIKEMQLYFNIRLHQKVQSLNKTMVGWDEVFSKDLPKSIIIQSWRGQDTMRTAAKSGFYSILSKGYYLNYMFSIHDLYLTDPIPVGITTDEHKYILGGEACIWGEEATEKSIDIIVWPALGSVSERLWSNVSLKNVSDIYRRLEILNWKLESFKILHLKNTNFMLRSQMKSKNIDYLEVLVNTLRPVGALVRIALQQNDQLCPLNFIADAAHPEPYLPYHFNKNLSLWMETLNPQLLDYMNQYLDLWEKNHQNLLPQLEKSPILWNIENQSKITSKLAGQTKDLLNFYQNHTAPSSEWLLNYVYLLIDAELPQGNTFQKITDNLKQIYEKVEKIEF